MIKNANQRRGFKLKTALASWFTFTLLTLLVMMGLTRPLDVYVVQAVPEFDIQINLILRIMSFMASAPLVFLIASIIFIYKLVCNCYTETTLHEVFFFHLQVLLPFRPYI